MPWFWSDISLDPPPMNRAAIGFASGRFALSASYANQAYSQAISLFGSLSVFDYTVPTEMIDTAIGLAAPNLGDAPTTTHPGEYTSGISEVVFPDVQGLREQLGLVEAQLEKVLLPPLDAVYLGLTPPDDIDTTLPEVPTDPPPISEVDIPSKPGYELPPVPTLEGIVIPAVPSLNEYSFEGEMPTMDITPPEPMFVYEEASYESNVADAIRTKLYQDITLGGTGLGDEIEAAIWANARDRLAAENAARYTEKENFWAARGWDRPTGALDDALEELNTEIARLLDAQNNEIMIEQARLAQQNTQFSIQSGLVHEQQLMAYTNQIAQRAFDRSKAIVEMAVTVYQAKIAAYTAQMEAYKTQATVFESKIRAELAKVEIYKAQIEGARLTADMQQTLVQIYSERVKAIGIVIELYRAEMEGAKIKSEIDAIKIDAFRAKVEAVSAQIAGITASYNLYQAKWTGEQIKVDLYGKQIDAYSKQVDAKKIEAEVNIAEAELSLSTNKDRVAVLEAAIEKYSAEVQGMVGEEQARVSAFGAKVGAYEAEVRGRSSHIDAQVARYRAEVESAATSIDAAIKQLEVFQRTETVLKEIQNGAIKAAAEVSSQLAASALSSVSASAQVGYSEAVSRSYGETKSISTGTSKSCSYLETKTLD